MGVAMRRMWIRVGVPVAAVGLIVSGGLALAAPMEPVNDAWDDLAATMAIVGPEGMSDGPPQIAQAFVDNNVYFGSTLQANMGSMAPGGGQVYQGRCEEIDVEPCASASTVNVSVILPTCSSGRAQDCVEGLYVRKGETVDEATFSKEWDGKDSYTFAAIPHSMGTTPASGKLPLYSMPSTPHSGGPLYAASVQLDFSLTRTGSGWRGELADLAAQILPVSEIPFSYTNTDCMDVGSSGRTDTSCLSSGYRLPDESFGLKVRVSANFGQWIFGRVIDPQIRITETSSQIILDVEGRPSVTPQALGILPVADVPPGGLLGRPHEKGTLLTSFAAGQFGSLSRWDAWNSIVDSTSAALKRLWIYRSKDVSFSPLAACTKPGVLSGWISTNAMVYEAAPPMYNASSGAMDFRIGGPAFQPNGSSPVTAEYDLLLRSEVAACAWQGRKITQVATVSVIGGADGEEVTSTSVGESGGWVKFVARNVFFPQPAGTRARAGTTNPTVRVVIPPAADPNVFATCKAMWKKYKDGVSYTGAVNTVTVKGKKVVRPALGKPFVSDAIYSANMKLDKDTDGLVCEREPKVK